MARFAPRALHFSMARSTAAFSPALPFSLPLRAGGHYVLIIEIQHRRHRPLALRHRFLHRLRAKVHQRQAIGKAERAGRRERRVLAQAMPGRELRRWPAKRAPCAVHGIAGGDHRGLRVDRLVQRFGRSFVQQPHERGAERSFSFFQNVLDLRQAGVALQHADRLRALPWKHHGQLHRVTNEEPQVKPPPTPCSSRRSPALIFPARRYSSSASGTEAAEVLPWWSTVTTSFSRGRPSLRAVASRMRMLAWCGISQSTSSSDIFAMATVSRADSSSTRTANLNTAWPSILRNGVPRMAPPQTLPGTDRMSA